MDRTEKASFCWRAGPLCLTVRPCPSLWVLPPSKWPPQSDFLTFMNTCSVPPCARHRGHGPTVENSATSEPFQAGNRGLGIPDRKARSQLPYALRGLTSQCLHSLT